MDDVSVCAPLLAESDTQNNTSNAPNAASVIDADKVINTKIDNSQGEGDTDEEERLQCLLADTYCHVCDAVLKFESQRLSHYEGKRHAQKVKVYLQTKRAEKTKTVSAGAQSTMTTDKTRFCELCNMVFTSSMVSKSHYEGKVHAKNLRKQGFQSPVIIRNTEVSTLPRPTQDPDQALQSSAAEGGVQHHVDLGATTTTSSTEVDLKDPNKYCALCTASFNNPQMALQHYNGRKHQRNQSRQELMRRLGDDVQQADQLMCQMCSLEFNSVEMYQAHVQGSKHQIRKKKVIDLCKSQQKVYGTFADELADYVQVQKARGITSKTTQVLPQGDTLNREEEEEEEEEEEGLHHLLNTKRHITELNKPMPIFTPTPDPLHLSGPGCYYPAKGWHPSYHPHNWDYSCSPPVLPGPGSLQFTSRPIRGRKRRRQSSSSSSSYTTSSSSSHSPCSSSSSSISERDDSEYKRRERRRIRRSKKERGRRTRDKDSDEEEKTRSKKQRKDQEDDKSAMARRGESVESEQGRRRRRQKEHGKRRKKSREVEFEEEGGGKGMHNPMPEDSVDSRKYNEVHIQTEMNVEQREDGQDEATKAKYRKEKKKVKEKADTRTEEEKLWDDSILGC
ncbi:zinc finger matrin-type protein 1 [Solea solea]|uniref:zinc finger matrin-type protein 1 n=1 Tax=Solea solea TaxID=90069 RepID=UPI00272D24FD|nr:zinc finger matrin-type protein 1 [Solea solea]